MANRSLVHYSDFELILQTCAIADEKVSRKLDAIISEFQDEDYPPSVVFEILARHIIDRLERSKGRYKIPKQLQVALRMASEVNR